MKRNLIKSPKNEIYHIENGIKKMGPPTGVRGDLSGVRGDLDTCDITPENREAGINVSDLIQP
jgi:hypothetical protein